MFGQKSTLPIRHLGARPLHAVVSVWGTLPGRVGTMILMINVVVLFGTTSGTGVIFGGSILKILVGSRNGPPVRRKIPDLMLCRGLSLPNASQSRKHVEE